MINNSYRLLSLDYETNALSSSSKPPTRDALRESPCLPSRLPSIAFLQREGENIAPQTLLHQLQSISTEPHPVDSSNPNHHTRTLSRASDGSSILSVKADSQDSSIPVTEQWKEPQPYEIFRAIEQKDIVFLMEVRDRAFHLLLRRSGDATPLLHAMRIGQSHRHVAIILVGAMSRFVNHLEDGDLQKPHIKTLLKALRTNLKLAIDYGLQQSQGDLIASFMQCLIMSEGDKWVWSQVSTIALALRAGNESRPVRSAEQAVRKFATRELGKASLIAALEDYVANATVDLLLIAAWVSASEVIGGEQIPTYYFARDDRVYKAFVERVQKNRTAIARSLTKRLKWQIRILEEVLEGRTQSYRSKVDILAIKLDESSENS